MKAYGGLEVKLHTLLILTLDGGEWSVSCSKGFILGTRRLGGTNLTYWRSLFRNVKAYTEP
jgi:hypothetical protein